MGAVGDFALALAPVWGLMGRMTSPEPRLAKRACAALCLTGFVCLALCPLGQAEKKTTVPLKPGQAEAVLSYPSEP